MFFCHTLKFCNVGDDCVKRSYGEFVVKGYGNPELFIANDLPQLDVTSSLPEKRKTEFFKDFDYLKSTNNRTSR